MRVQRQSKQEYLARMQRRYLKANKPEKGKLLDEVVEVRDRHGAACLGWAADSGLSH